MFPGDNFVGVVEPETELLLFDSTPPELIAYTNQTNR